MPRLTLTSSQVFVVLTGGLLAGSSAATATPVGPTLPAATTFTQCASGGPPGLVEGSSTCSQSDVNGSDDVTSTLLPFAGVSAVASVAGDPQEGFSGFATLDYSFEIIGGNTGDQVPLLIFTNLFTSIGGDAYAFSEIIVSAGSTSLGSVVACQSYGGSCPGNAAANFSGSFGVTVSSGTVETFQLEVEASPNPALGPATASASADPLIEINPSFSNAADYSIVQSSGVGNATASTPEPGTLILIGCGGPFLLLARRYLRAERLALTVLHRRSTS
jgi:hypothetical protein